MVGKNDFGFGLAYCNRLLDKVQTLLMSAIEVCRTQAFFAKLDAMKISPLLLGIVCVLQINMRPQRRADHIYIF